jgi:hypothetical protein
MVMRRGCWGLALALAAVTIPCQPLNRLAAQPPQRSYICYRTPAPITIDGRLDDPAWRAAPWSERFVDILGDTAPAPPLETRVKLLWDDDYLYVAAELEEPHVWSALTERDATIYQDDDFEIFIDPDGDTHQYYEIEINALGTIWDLFLVKPYRDGGRAISAWDIRNLRSAVDVDGSVNDPSDRDDGWTVEFAIPWQPLVEIQAGKHPPRDGERWRVNFSRVDWDVAIEDGRYRKTVDPSTGRVHEEHNWVWSPQGAVNMHMPEMWGVVQFSDTIAGSALVELTEDPDARIRWVLREVYYAERRFFRQHRRYTDEPARLGIAPDAEALGRVLAIAVTPTQFEARLPSSNDAGTWRIRQDGRVWLEPLRAAPR